MPGGLQGAAQFAEVVDFAVADDGDVARFIKNGLSPAGKVNDAQTAHAERRAGCACGGDEQAFAVRSAMRHGRHHSADKRFRSEEHTSELQSRLHLVCRLLLEKKKNSEYVCTVADLTQIS